MPTTYGRSRDALLHAPASGYSSGHSFLLSSSSPSGPSSEILTPPPSSPPMSRAKRARLSSPCTEPSENDASAFASPATHPPGTAARQGSLKGFCAPLPRRAPLGPAAMYHIASSSPSRPTTKNATVRKEQRTVISPVKPRHATLAQTQLTHLPLLQSCRECGMSYMRGGDDEGMHARHHARVIRGIVWTGATLASSATKGKERAGTGGGAQIKVVRQDVRFGPRGTGRGKVVMLDGSAGGTKTDEILHMVDTVLSAPALPGPILSACKIFLLITASPPPPPTNGRKRKLAEARADSAVKAKERVIGVVVAQPIKWAMRVLTEDQEGKGIDSGGGVLCDPTPLPTPLGIHRMFVLPPYRSLGLARILLDIAAAHTVYGCSFDPRRGEAAFSQPTESGRKVMEAWGGGAVRVFVDDESQL